MEKSVKQEKQIITSFFEILDKIPQDETLINLSSHMIKDACLEVLPLNIINVILIDNMVEKFSYGDRKWDLINLKNNGFTTEEIIELNCRQLILDDNNIPEISFIRCNIEMLFIVGSNVKNINFYDCDIKELNISVNSIKQLTTLPNNLKVLEAYGNYISDIYLPFSDTIEFINLSDNELTYIPNIPQNLTYLDLSQNKFITFDTTNFPKSINYFKITDNDIKNNNELFDKIDAEKLFYDTDEDEDEDKGEDEYKYEDEDEDSDSSINIKKKKKQTLEDDISSNFSGDISDDEVSDAIREYKKNEENFEKKNKNYTSDILKVINIEDIKPEIKENIQSDEIIKKRELIYRASISRIKQQEEIKKEEKIYSECIPIRLQWKFIV